MYILLLEKYNTIIQYFEHSIRATFLWPWFSVLTVYLRAIFVFLSVFFRCVHLLWLPTAAVKTLQYSQATVMHQYCKTIAFLKLQSQSQTSFKRSSQRYQISRFHQASILSLRAHRDQLSFYPLSFCPWCSQADLSFF